MPEGAAPVLVVAGPTAVGKSRLALDVAEAVGAEVVSADSRQVYRGLDVGTAAPSAADRARVPHHLVASLAPGEPYSAGQFLRSLGQTLADLRARRVPAVVVGGSTLYVEAIVRGLADLPALPDAVAAPLAEAAASPEGRDRLYAELAVADPDAAATLDPTKSHRLARLVGLLRHTGRPPSELWRERAVPPAPHVLVVLDRPREELYRRIDRRVDRMVADGLEDEVRRLYARGDRVRPLLRATIGYREVVGVLEGRHDWDEAVRLIKRNSRRYAKRQLTWYRRYPDALWLDARTATAGSLLDAVAPWPRSR